MLYFSEDCFGGHLDGSKPETPTTCTDTTETMFRDLGGLFGATETGMRNLSRGVTCQPFHQVFGVQEARRHRSRTPFHPFLFLTPVFVCLFPSRYVQAFASELGVPASYCAAASVVQYVDLAVRLCLDDVSKTTSIYRAWILDVVRGKALLAHRRDCLEMQCTR